MKIGLISLGCPKNLVDSEVMIGLAQEAGHEITGDAREADVLVVNTCAFIDRAKEESVEAILEMAALKQRGRARRLVVTGCLAERYRDELLAEVPEIDALLGTGDVPAIVEAIEGGGRRDSAPVRLFTRNPDGHPARLERRLAARHRETTARRPLPTYLYDARTPRTLTTPRHYAYVKVAEGCDYNCSFCIIPALRGAYRSRRADDILEEARRLVAGGVRELILVSQDTSFYGIDRGERGALARLLADLAAIDGLHWVRLLYLYPTTVSDEVLSVMASLPQVCRYIDLPLQHASDAVLRRMRRPGSRAAYERLLDHIRRTVPGVTLRTTFIVGFPGETEGDVRELLAFLEGVEFDHVGVFTYSHEEGTAAHGLVDDVPDAEKARRRDLLMRRQRDIVGRKQARRIGERVTVMVDGPAPDHPLVMRGRLEGQAPDIDPVVYFTECDPSCLRPGELVAAEITDAREYDLIARPLPAA